MIFRKLRAKIARRVIEKQSLLIERERALYNFQNAKNIAVIFSTTCPEEYNHIKLFLAYLAENKINVTPIVYVDNKKIPDYYHLSKNLNIITRKDVNWLNLPREHSIHKFIKAPYHMLIDLSTNFQLPIYYIVCMSLARFKIGRVVEKTQHYDLMIDTHENNSVEHLIEQIKYYTTVLKSPY